MYLRAFQVPGSLRSRLRSAAKDAEGSERSFILSGPTLTPLPHFGLLLLSALYGVAVYYNSDWGLHTYQVGGGVILGVLLVKAVRKYTWRRAIGRQFALVTPRFFTAVTDGGLRSYPTWDFREFKVGRAPDGNPTLDVKFAQGSVSFPFDPVWKEEAEVLLNSLHAYRTGGQQMFERKPLADRILSNTWDEWGDDDLYPEIEPRLKYGQSKDGTGFSGLIDRYRTEMIAAPALFLLLYLLTPIAIDASSFRKAEQVGTASAYRAYLKEDRNVRYRERSRASIKELYNHEITRYRARTRSPGETAFVRMLECLRDRDLYVVPVAFRCESAVESHGRADMDIVPIEPSFTPERNTGRESAIVERIQSTLGRSFPTDILTVESWRGQAGPRIAITYRYRNKEDSYYYPVEQEALPDYQRTWYYGIEIDWWFWLQLPEQDKALYSFSLRSEPAPRFSATSAGATGAYDGMAESAFADLERRFNAEFF